MLVRHLRAEALVAAEVEVDPIGADRIGLAVAIPIQSPATEVCLLDFAAPTLEEVLETSSPERAIATKAAGAVPEGLGATPADVRRRQGIRSNDDVNTVGQLLAMLGRIE